MEEFRSRAGATGGAFIVKDASGQTLTCVNFEEEQSRRDAGHMLEWEEARRIARGITRLPELLSPAKVET